MARIVRSDMIIAELRQRAEQLTHNRRPMKITTRTGMVTSIETSSGNFVMLDIGLAILK